MKRIISTIVLTFSLMLTASPANAAPVAPDCGSGNVTLETGCKVPDTFPAELRPVTSDLVSLFYQLADAMQAEVQRMNDVVAERDQEIAAQAERLERKQARIDRLRARLAAR